MALSASELYEAGMGLPPSVRRDVALRLLESLELVDAAEQALVDEAWTAEIGDRVDDVLNGAVEIIPGDQVFSDIAVRRAARNA